MHNRDKERKRGEQKAAVTDDVHATRSSVTFQSDVEKRKKIKVREHKYPAARSEEEEQYAALKEARRINKVDSSKAHLDKVATDLRIICDGIRRLNLAIDTANNSYSLLIKCERDERKLQQDVTLGILKTVLSVISMAAAVEAAQAGTGLAFLSASTSRAIEQNAPTTMVGVEQTANPLIQDTVALFQEDHLHQDDAYKQTKELNQSIYMINALLGTLYTQFENLTKPPESKTDEEKEKEIMAEVRKELTIEANRKNPLLVSQAVISKKLEKFIAKLDSDLEKIPAAYRDVLHKLGSTPSEDILELKMYDRYLLRRNNAKYLTRDYYKPAPEQHFAVVATHTPPIPGFIKLARIGQPGVHYELPAFLNPVVEDKKLAADENKAMQAARQNILRLLDPHPQGEAYLAQKAGYRKTRVGSKSLRQLVWDSLKQTELYELHKELQIVSGTRPTYKHSGKLGKMDPERNAKKDKMRDLWRSYAIVNQVFDCNGNVPPIVKSPEQLTNSIAQLCQIEAYFIRNGEYKEDVLKISPLCLMRKVPDYKYFLSDPEVVKLLQQKLTPEFILQSCLTNHHLAGEQDLARLNLALENIIEFMKIIPGADLKGLELLRQEGVKYIDHQRKQSQAKLYAPYEEKSADRLVEITTEGGSKVKWGGVEVELSQFLNNARDGKEPFAFNHKLSASTLFPVQDEVKSDKEDKVKEKGVFSPSEPGLGLSLPGEVEVREPSHARSSGGFSIKLPLGAIDEGGGATLDTERLDTDRSARPGLPNVLNPGRRATVAHAPRGVIIEEDEKGQSVLKDKRKTESKTSHDPASAMIGSDKRRTASAQREESVTGERKELKDKKDKEVVADPSAQAETTQFLLQLFTKKKAPTVSERLMDKVANIRKKKEASASASASPPESKVGVGIG